MPPSFSPLLLTLDAAPLSSGTAFVRFAETSVVGASIV
jgi:hypothetical protein